MKLFLLFLLFQTINASANEKWIPLVPFDNVKTPKKPTHLDVNLSQIQPINKMLKNATAIKQLIDASSKEEKTTPNENSWFLLNSNIDH